MQVELVTIGTELLLGFTVDTNSAFVGQQLAAIGVHVVRRTSVGDDPAAIAGAVRDALARTGFVITTGGLGPTRDDITKTAVAALFDAPLEFQQPLWDDLVAKFARFGRVPSDANRCQAEVPRGAAVLANSRGTAPGLWLSGPPGEAVLLPGVPAEMRGLIADVVAPRLADRGSGAAIASLVVRTTGIPESTLGDRLAGLEPTLSPITLAYLPGLDGVDLRLTAWDVPANRAAASLRAAAAALRAELGDLAYGTGDDDIAAHLLGELERRGARLALAESCTGGLVGQRITAVPGSSATFVGGVIAYANEAKYGLLGVDPALVERCGAVSEEVAAAMARGAQHAFGVAAALSVTGIAGPDGGTPEKPVGTVCLGFAVGDRVDTRRIGFPGGRADVRARAAQAALHGLWHRLRAG
jgi:nicotinamide-nucleotide amidase